MSVDPNSNTWDLSGDPLRWATERVTLVREIQPKLEKRLITNGDGYNRLRGSLTGLLTQRYGALYPATKVIGGLYFNRDHKGDPNGRAPFVPVAAARQREALKLIIDNAFAPDAYQFDPRLLNSLPPTRVADWGGNWIATPIDYPVHEWVGMFQGWLLQDLLDGARLSRMVDNEVRMPAGQQAFGVDDLFSTLTDGIWTEVAAGRARNIDSFRRNLQRMHVKELTRIMYDTRTNPFVSPVPEDARSLARLELTQLSGRLGTALNTQGLDNSTKAHLVETKARIDKALEASMIAPTR
jgi:hypothetical protein